MGVCVPLVCSNCRGKKRVSDHLEEELRDPKCWETNVGSLED